MSHRCAVFGCANDRRRPDKWIIKKHVSEHMGKASLRFYSCPEKYYKKWENIISRQHYSVTKNTRVCSNHFQYGQPRERAPHPSMFLRGKPSPQCKRKLFDRVQKSAKTPPHATPLMCHDYGKKPETSEACQTCQQLRAKIADLEQEILNLNEKNEKILEKVKEIEDTPQRMCIEHLKGNNKLLKTYTGVASHDMFEYLYSNVQKAASNMQYFKGQHSTDDKTYQVKNSRKPGPKRTLTQRSELLLTLMKLRLDLKEDDLAFRFQVSQSVVSQTISTWIPLLARELQPLVFWPPAEIVQQYYPKCFERFGKNVTAIIDCTEVQTQRPTLDVANSQLFSDYKQRHTFKVLVACTPGGAVSFISACAGGDMTDVQMVRESGLLDMLVPGTKVLADKGFHNKDDFLKNEVELIIPQFARKAVQFSEESNVINAGISNARIHVERVIGRLKEFDILHGPIPLVMKDLLDDIFQVCGALVNLQGILVPLNRI